MVWVCCTFLVSFWASPAIALGSTTASLPERQATPSNVMPTPIVVPVSQYFEGDSGNWSTINIRVGTSAQSVRGFVSTNSPITGVVRPNGCELDANPKGVPENCINSRGGTFNNNASSTWVNSGWFTLNGGNGVGFEANLGYSLFLNYGLDTIALGYQDGPNSPTLSNQTVAAYNLPNPLYLGFLGIGVEPVIYETFGNYSAPSFFKQLADNGAIPGLSWSYTAGASYQLSGGQYMQLIFGGYDTSRFVPNNVHFTLSADVTRDIVVGVQSILHTGSTTTELLPTPIYAFVESTDPNIWLPVESCLLFEKVFGLTWDDSTSKYLLNDTQYSILSNSDPTVTFRLAVSTAGGMTGDITLPFKAFGLRANYPYVPQSTYYFPLKRASNSSQYTLGRVFLQEAYLTVDYDRKNFSLSQCTFVQGASPQVLSILGPTAKNESLNGTVNVPGTTNDDSQRGNTAIIVSCVIASILVVLASGIGFWCWKKRKSSKKDIEGSTAARLAAPIDNKPSEDSLETIFSKPELDIGGEVFEVDGSYKTHEADGTMRSFANLETITGLMELDGHASIQELAGSPVSRSDDSEDMYRRISSPLPRTFEPKATSAPVSPLSPPIPQSSFKKQK